MTKKFNIELTGIAKDSFFKGEIAKVYTKFPVTVPAEISDFGGSITIISLAGGPLKGMGAGNFKYRILK